MILGNMIEKRFLSSILILFVFFPGAVFGASSPPVALLATAPFSGGSGGGDHSTSMVLSLSSLPAVLHSFTVVEQGRSRLISWRVSGEGTESYHVERSFDGRHFEDIDQMPITGNTPEKHLFTCIDSDPLRGGVYYRLRIQEADGRHRYSDVRFLALGKSDWGFTVLRHPGNPAGMKLRFSGIDQSEALGLRVHTFAGRTVLQRESIAYTPDFPVDLPSGLPRGSYVITVIRVDGSVRSCIVPLVR